MCSKTRWDRIKKDAIRERERVGVAPIVEKMWKIDFGGLGM
jgi:hypothetical protein